MQALTKRLSRHLSPASRAAAQQSCRIEPLEGRTLLSATWQTVDDFQLAAGHDAGGNEMTADPAGNLFASGGAADAAGVSHSLIREKLNGAPGWSTVVDVPFYFNNAHVNAAGDIYVSSGSNAAILERHVGQTTFDVVDQNPPVVGRRGATTNNASVVGITIDAQKNVFVLEMVDRAWVVRKQTGGVGAFATVNTFSSNLDGFYDAPTAITAVASGTAAGLYVIGSSAASPSHSILRRSTDGGVTWSTIDTFQYAPANDGFITRAYAVAGDTNGHICITGPATTRTVTGGTKAHPVYSHASYWVTREGTADASGKWTWAVLDAFPIVGGDEPSCVALDGNGNVFVVGATTTATGSPSVIRNNLGGTWHTDAADQNSNFGEIAADAGGNVYVNGDAQDSAGIAHWVVRSPVPAAAPASATTSSSTLTTAAAPASTFSSVPIAPSTADSQLLFSHPKDESLFAL